MAGKKAPPAEAGGNCDHCHTIKTNRLVTGRFVFNLITSFDIFKHYNRELEK
jgi:hypothetical protein